MMSVGRQAKTRPVVSLSNDSQSQLSGGALGRVSALTAGLVFTAAALLSACEPSDRSAALEAPQPEESPLIAQEEYLISAAEALDSFETDGLWKVSPYVPATDLATRAGFLVDFWEDQPVEGGLQLEVRGRDSAGFETEWVPSTLVWAEAPHAVVVADFEWPVGEIQFRVVESDLQRVAHFHWAGAIPEQGELPDHDAAAAPAPNADQFAQHTGALSTALANLGVKPRSAWGAVATKCSGSDAAKYRVAIHHTATPATTSGSYTARIKGIQAFHMNTNGWCDIGYHFLITADGSMWEGRPIQFTGAHTGGQNTGNAGISFVGCFHSSGCANLGGTMQPSANMLNAAAKLLAHLAKTYNFKVDTNTVRGHKDFPGQSTSCPGDQLSSKLAQIRSSANTIISGPPPAPTPTTGRILGVVFDGAKTSTPTATGNVRLTAAKVSLNGGTAISVSNPDALFVFDKVAAGTHKITITAPGYQSATKTVTVTGGSDTWASTGLTPVPTTATLTITVVQQSGTNLLPLNGAIVHVPGFGAKQAGSNGKVTFTVNKSSVTAHVFNAGFTAKQNISIATPLGTTKNQSVTLVKAPALTGSVGKILGVVWNLAKTAGPSDAGNQRVTNAIVTCSCGQAMVVNSTSALWQFTVPAGTWTMRAIAPGYTEKAQTITALGGKDVWGSIGLMPGK